jgi:hypothetical protein
MSFSDEFDEESRNAILATQEVTRLIAFSAFNYAINVSPVGNEELWEVPKAPRNYVGGQFRSNWFMSMDAPSSSVTDATNLKGRRIA